MTEDRAVEARNELAEDRTEWAHERTLLAKERTFSAWVRTGLAAIAAGLGVARLLEEMQPEWLVTALAAAFVLAGVIALTLGLWSYRKTLKQLEEEGVRSIPSWLIGVFTLALVVSAGIGLVLILLN